ncbi:MAG TPA: ATP-binding protein, partial [Verrucomicrobiae bacterium]
ETHKDEIGLLMTDQRMPGEKGVWLLERARKLRPRIIRVLATAYADMDAAIAAVNSGAIYKYVSKPWDPPQLEETLKHGLEFFIVQTERDKLKFQRLFELLFKDELATLPAGSRISLKAELQNESAKPEIVLHISDNGPGLPEEALRVIFDPFVVQGSVPSEYGINLMACFFIVHHHGGKIEAKSRAGHGTTFIIRLPLQPERAASSSLDDGAFLQKALLNEGLWEKLLTVG